MNNVLNDSAIDDRESRLRSLLKAVTYRITGTITTALLVYFITGEWRLALAVGAIEPVVKVIIYYVHERVWQLVPRGTIRRWSKARHAG
ncbi:MAG: DUF2061 domain-containing protein [Woeseia sp.]|nr:DUF2061 domain-containing protein [Woeseia sp.]MBT8097596.1 DUF2061 domain-containing protein [Woeseia sp.]NNE61429.1 DUF2061 domain-containing protein [Woeseia sp.]NNL53911.1 DUF2061 domain-containing protein [Woeseia sp.]